MKVGIIGLGTVGEGVLKVLTLEKENIKIKSNCELEVKYACDLNIDRQFSFDFDKYSSSTQANDIFDNLFNFISVMISICIFENQYFSIK